jgi:hypothetical protein
MDGTFVIPKKYISLIAHYISAKSAEVSFLVAHFLPIRKATAGISAPRSKPSICLAIPKTGRVYGGRRTGKNKH